MNKVGCLIFLGALLIFIFWTGCSNKEERKEKALAKHQDRAKAYMESGKVKEAEIELKNVIQLNPKDDTAHYDLGEARMQKGEITDALKSYWRAVDLNRENLKAILKLGRLYLAANRTRDARTAVTMLLEKAPDNIDVLSLLTNVQIQERDIAGAMETLNKAVSLYPEHVGVNLALGRLHLMIGELDQADHAFVKATTINPGLKHILQESGEKYRSKPVLTKYYEINRQWNAAERMYLEAVESASDGNVSPLMELAAFYMRREAYDPALKTLNQALAIRNNDPKIRMKIANLHFYFNKFEDAEAVVNDLLMDHNWYTEANFLKGKLLFHRKDYDSALDRFDRVINDSPRYSEAHYHKGLCLMQTGEIEKAQMALREAVELNPYMVGARLALAKSYLKDYKTGSNSLASVQLKAVLKQVPDHKEALMLQGRVNLDVKDLEGAEDVIKTLLKKYPEYADAHFRLGLVYQLTKRQTEALESFNTTLDLDPFHIEALRFIVNIHANNKAFDKALKICEFRAKKVNDQPLVMAAIEDQKGKLYLTKGEVDQAEVHFKRAIELDINLVSSHMVLTQIYMREKKVDQVIAHFESALKKNPKLLAGYMVLGGIYDKRGETEKAEALYRKALKIKEDFAPAANNLAYNLAERKINLNEAMQFAEIAKQKRPEDPVVLDTLGWVYYLLGHHAKAIPHLAKSVDRMPDNPLFQYHLGKAYHKNEQLDMARASLEKVLTLDPSFKEADDIRNILESYRSLG